MDERTVTHSTFVIERTYPAPPERVFAAFSDPGTKRKWFVEGEGHEVEEFEMDFRAGGRELARFRFRAGTPVAGLTCLNEASYLDVVPGRRIVQASRMNIGGRTISASLVTVEIAAADAGTHLVLTHQGAFFEGSDGPQMREGGWRKLMDRLAGALQ